MARVAPEKHVPSMPANQSDGRLVGGFMQEDRRFYVYAHRRKTDGSIFYVGKGQGNRCNVSFGRNPWWHHIAEKHGWEVEILAGNLTNKEAMAREKLEIASRKGLVNLTTGGEGFEIHHAAKHKMRLAKLGKPQSLEHAAKSRSAKLGKKQPVSAVEGLRQRKSKPIISSDGEIFPSASEAARVLSRRLGKYVSQGNISMCARDMRDNAYGVSWSYDLTKIPAFRPRNYQEKMTLCVEAGLIFKSTQKAKEWVKGWRGTANGQCITQAAREGTMAYGYHWKYVADDEELPDAVMPDVEKLRRYAA